MSSLLNSDFFEVLRLPTAASAAWTFAWIWNHPDRKVRVWIPTFLVNANVGKRSKWKKVESHLNQCSHVLIYRQEFSPLSVLFQSKLWTQTRHGRPLLPEPPQTWRQLPSDLIHSLAEVQEASLHPRLMSSAVAALVSSGFPKCSDWFSQQFYLPLLARPLLVLWHYYHVVLVVCFATWRARKKGNWFV